MDRKKKRVDLSAIHSKDLSSHVIHKRRKGSQAEIESIRLRTSLYFDSFSFNPSSIYFKMFTIERVTMFANLFKIVLEIFIDLVSALNHLKKRSLDRSLSTG